MSNHFEGLGKTWLTLLNDPEKEVPAVVMQVMKEGKTRDCWQRKDSKEETMVLAWPVETGFRAGVTVHGNAGDQLRPVSTYPLLEGAPNDMTVNETYLWQNETEGEVSATCNEGANPLWFYSPFLFRDRENLTPGVRHTFLIAGLAYGLRRALLDERPITEGVEYERYVAEWLAQNPGKTRLDVPQLTVDLRGARIVVPGDVASEYQIRVPVTSVEEMYIQNEKIYMLIVEFGLNTPNPLRFPLYAPERVCKIVPQAGDEIDAIIWLQGRIID